jgi:hypothetical protein
MTHSDSAVPSGPPPVRVRRRCTDHAGALSTDWSALAAADAEFRPSAGVWFLEAGSTPVWAPTGTGPLPRPTGTYDIRDGREL